MIYTQQHYLLTWYPIRMFYNWTKFCNHILIFKFQFNFKRYLLTNYTFLIKHILNIETWILDSKTQSSTKTRHDIEKSNKKYRPQKGLGKARLGSLKSPLVRGGGIIFGPMYKNVAKLLKTKPTKLTKEILLFNKRHRILILKQNSFYPISNFNEHIKYQLFKLGVPVTSKILLIWLENICVEQFCKIKIVNIKNVLTLDLLTADYIIFCI
uniref:Large ribosomal subunit protein uL4m n=1 Tax=Nephromyces sp. ex Molgula occidentalis TaxID=2544991 RepID=A0A5C1H808_9APIC|nr:50S ribosomal protein L4 [Nephromyces sp. ex Molgula occidentalis]